MSSNDMQIKTSFEELGLTVEEIAQETGYEILAIKTILLNCSPIYRKQVKKQPSIGYSPDEAQEMRDIMINIARYEDEDKHLQFKAAKYIYDDFKGRNDQVAVNNNTINIGAIQFNDQMKKALEARERTMKQIVDVESKKEIAA